MSQKPRTLPASILARRAAASAMKAILTDKEALEAALERQEDYQGLEARDRAFARLIVATTCRHHGQIIKALKPFIRQPPPIMVIATLQTAAAQILFLKTPPHAAVGETVEVLKSRHSTRGFANMGNAVLRKVVTEGPKLAVSVAPRDNIPGWIRGAWERAYGRAELRKMATQLMKGPPLDLSVKSNTDEWAARLDATKVGENTIRLPDIGHVTALEGFDEGDWWVQDIGASLPVTILETAMTRLGQDLAGKAILDMCAAPGGKTLQLANRGAKVTALDKSETRMKRVYENLERTKLTAKVVCRDALEWDADQKFDAILLDAPCSATGTFRRHPDVLLNRTPKDVSNLVKLQAKMLRKAAGMLNDEGVLVYAVCSLQPEESAAQITRFLSDFPDFRLIPMKEVSGLSLPEARFEGGMVRTLPSDLPDLGGIDGFFIAAMQRVKN